MYQLRTILEGHDLDVRSLASIDTNTILSGSRDATARVWDLSPRLDRISASEICFTSPTSSFINSVAFVDSPLTGRVAAVAGKDAVIYLCDVHDSFLKPGDDFGKFQLVGHQGNVCSLNYADGALVSGSWDCTAKVWDLASFSVKHDLKGHSASVWDAKVVDAANEIYLTCSADGTIRKWQGSTEVARYSGHNDVVRKLLILPDGKHFVSASNDCTLKVWDLATGAVIRTLSGHESFIYDVAVLSNGDLVSTAEDRSVRVWRNGQAVQAITLPCISVWSVAVLANDDIAVGCSDRKVYVFTAAEDRQATADSINEFRRTVQDLAISEQSLDSLKKTDLPGYEALQDLSVSEGTTKMVKSPAGVIEAHQFSSGQWVKIGDVVGSAGGSSGKTEYQGAQYDYVFDVDVEDGKPPLKLPYNANENPYTAAEKFLANNDLPSSYTDEVVRFIEQNTSGVSLGGGPAPSAPTPALTSAPAPASASSSAPASASSLLPEKSLITFKEFKLDQLMKGFTKFNSDQPEEKKFSATEVRQVMSALRDPKSKDCIFFISHIVPKILKEWNTSQRLIGFDLLRVSIARVTTVDLIQSTDAAEEVLRMLLKSLDEVGENDVALIMMIARVLCNLTGSTLFAQLFFTLDDNNVISMNEFFEDFVNKLTVVIKIITSSPTARSSKHYKNTLAGLAAFLYDLSAFAFTTSSLKNNTSALNSFASILEDVGEDLAREDEEAAYRLYVALGNLTVLKVVHQQPVWFKETKTLYTSDRLEKLYRELSFTN